MKNKMSLINFFLVLLCLFFVILNRVDISKIDNCCAESKALSIKCANIALYITENLGVKIE